MRHISGIWLMICISDHDVNIVCEAVHLHRWSDMIHHMLYIYPFTTCWHYTHIDLKKRKKTYLVLQSADVLCL